MNNKMITNEGYPKCIQIITMKQFLSLISMNMYPLHSHDTESQLFLCIKYVFLLWVQMLLSLAVTLITSLHCSIQLATDYSPFRLATLCLINYAKESPFRLAIHSYYTGSSQLSLISGNYTLAWLYQWKSQFYSSLTLSMKVQSTDWLTLSMQVQCNE